MTPFMKEIEKGLHSRATLVRQLELLLEACAEIDLDGYARGYDQALIDERIVLPVVGPR